MPTQHKLDQWLQLRWNHYYEWKNLLDFEREAREEMYQKQLDNLPEGTCHERSQAIRKQVEELQMLRQENAVKRLNLRERQEQEREALRKKIKSEGDPSYLHQSENLSILRRS